MITTGVPNYSVLWSSTRRTEVKNLANNITCSDLAKFPVERSGAVGANLGGTPVVCGGYYPSYYGSPFGYSDKCYRFINGVWEEFASMKEKRAYAAAVVYNKTLHVFGGLGGPFYYKTSEIINLDGDVSDGPDVPVLYHVVWHAMTAISDTVSLLSGGNQDGKYYSTRTWYYNHDTQTFTDGPDLLEGRMRHGSAIVVDKVTKAKIVVVTGGKWYMDSTEMLINGQWETGTNSMQKKMF